MDVEQCATGAPDLMRAIFDSTLALITLLLLSPVLLLIALAVALDSPGNPLYLARRVGRFGKTFVMFKFRTMVPNAAQLGPPITGNRDPRVTRIGAFLRKTKLDELPQFVNVLLGDMNLVGPRPEAPEIVVLYTPSQRQILQVKPGMTGKVQIEGDESEKIPQESRADDYYVRNMMDRKLRSDLDYLRTRTLLTDIQILLSTALFVLRSFARR